MQTQLKKAGESMDRRLEHMRTEFSEIRAGRANPAVLDKVKVDYYGAPTPVNQLAAVSVTEARTLTIQPWDASVLRQIEKAIQTSDIGINPQNDGKIIRLIFPPLTEDRSQSAFTYRNYYGRQRPLGKEKRTSEKSRSPSGC